MTLEEAKKKIYEFYLEAQENYKRIVEPITYGEMQGLYKALSVFAEVVPVENPDPLTLRTFAIELRKLFKFRYLTISGPYDADAYRDEPHWAEADKDGPGYWISAYGCVFCFEPHAIRSLDLSEYAGADGNIDYSKCIVEVSDDAE